MKKIVHVVGAVIENKQGEVLAALRSPVMTLPNYWEFPGGKIEEGETRQEALQREIQEELGCRIQVGEAVEDTTYEYEKVIVRLETFMAAIVEGTPAAAEHAELRWVARDQLAALDWAPADIPAIEKLTN
ncbi:DNA mismatch repair protein MutT [Sporosarcina sp. P37]|uniref:(deoxy)nucleoside triphosphate pyrophosphohydrolase n=1 Tax=unclassified Sporosarcina TaxID=2647733 RepID=UPI0009C0880F|nr:MULTISPECIES: (deoxy)nucleoside triphosphate pyrophosphohydrolase [unclassified Sporosarcina]ARD48332.1 DNA mismatch repair protein MutT [Sporosarcina sp. P33]ARK24836.1 DNA mismatch repair protein MutT [Sporosarcina sp. P37]PID19996.1 (deoxy)nucleoside triphosphate pyrophosphohydrolase [Sporosarcina sp. P35]